MNPTRAMLLTTRLSRAVTASAEADCYAAKCCLVARHVMFIVRRRCLISQRWKMLKRKSEDSIALQFVENDEYQTDDNQSDSDAKDDRALCATGAIRIDFDRPY